MPPFLSMGEASSSSGHLTADDYDDERKVSAFLSIYLITTSLHEETINQELVTQFITRHLLLMLISQPAHYRTAYLCIFTTKLPQGFATNLACAVVYICVRVIYGQICVKIGIFTPSCKCTIRCHRYLKIGVSLIFVETINTIDGRVRLPIFARHNFFYLLSFY